MAYTILNTDGTTLLLLSDSGVDQSTTSLSLVGKNVSGYGQYLNNNFISLLENFANSSNNPPRSPLTGQLWYDTTAGKLNVYDGGFKSVSGATVSTLQPNVFSSGDLWWDSTNNQLKISHTNQVYTVGPAFPQSIGATGWTLPDITLVDTTSSTAQDVLLLENYGTMIGALSNQTFDLTRNDLKTYFKTASTTTLVQGLNIFGNIQASGQINNNYLSASADVSKMTSLAGGQLDVSVSSGYDAQNLVITKMLNSIFPVVANTSTNEVGVPLGSCARVVVNFTLPSGRGGIDYMQFRRFTVVNNPVSGITWSPTEIYSNIDSGDTFNSTNHNVLVTGKTLVNIIPKVV